MHLLAKPQDASPSQCVMAEVHVNFTSRARCLNPRGPHVHSRLPLPSSALGMARAVGNCTGNFARRSSNAGYAYRTTGSIQTLLRMTDPGRSSPGWNLDEIQDVVEERVGVKSMVCTPPKLSKAMQRFVLPRLRSKRRRVGRTGIGIP